MYLIAIKKVKSVRSGWILILIDKERLIGKESLTKVIEKIGKNENECMIKKWGYHQKTVSDRKIMISKMVTLDHQIHPRDLKVSGPKSFGWFLKHHENKK